MENIIITKDNYKTELNKYSVNFSKNAPIFRINSLEIDYISYNQFNDLSLNLNRRKLFAFIFDKLTIEEIRYNYSYSRLFSENPYISHWKYNNQLYINNQQTAPSLITLITFFININKQFRLIIVQNDKLFIINIE